MIDIEEVVGRMNRRDGMSIATYREIGLPVYRLNCVVTSQETGEIGAIEEFVLRSVASGVTSLQDLKVFLGLPEQVVVAQLGRSIFDGMLEGIPGEVPRYRITLEGRERIEIASSSKLTRSFLPLYFDAITRSLSLLQKVDLHHLEDLDLLGIGCIPPPRAVLPTPDELDLGQVDRIAGIESSTDPTKKKVVRVDSFVGRARVFFLRGVAVVFKSSDGRQINVSFAVDGRESEEHEIAYAEAASRSRLFGDMFDSTKRRRDIRAANREVRELIQSSGSRAQDQLGKAAAAPAGSRQVSVLEHPSILEGALRDAEDRVLIVSPCISASVVNESFIHLLGTTLQRGVNVTTIYGGAPSDPKERARDKEARQGLEALAQVFPNFRLVKRGNTRAKILLVDRRFVVITSFNWLSFKGDPDLPLREEEGYLLEDSAAVDECYKKQTSFLA